MNPEDMKGGGAQVGASAASPLHILQREEVRRQATVVKGGGAAQEAGGLLGEQTNDLFGGASFDLSDGDGDDGPPRSSFMAEAGDWFGEKFSLRICGRQIGAEGARKLIFSLAGLLCVVFLVVLVNAASGDDVHPIFVGTATGQPVRAQLTVETDLAYISPGTATRASFELHFRQDVAAQLEVSAERVVIESVAAGSVVVTFSVQPDSNGVGFAPTALARTFGGGRQIDIAGHPVAGLTILDGTPEVSQSAASGGGGGGGAAVSCAAGQWQQQVFDDTSFTTMVDESCREDTRDGFLSTCGNYKNNGCWGPIGQQCPRELTSCENFSAKFTTSLVLAAATDYRFFVSMDDRAVISIDGRQVFTSVCEWTGTSCAQQTFDRSLSAGAHEVLVEYVQTSQVGGGAYADLKWVELGQPCADGEWRVELYRNADFTSNADEAPIATSCEPMAAVADHSTGSLSKLSPWCPSALAPCGYFSAIYTLTTSFPEVGLWIFDLSSSSDAWVALDDVHLTPSGCGNVVGSRCETQSYSHRIDDTAVGGVGPHKISVFFAQAAVGSGGAGAHMRLDWASAGGEVCRGWEVSIYDAPHLGSYIESICTPEAAGGRGELDLSGLATGTQIAACDLQSGTGGNCWCPEGLTVLAGNTSRCQHWSATFTRVVSFRPGGMYRFLVRANVANPATQVLVSIDGVQISYDGCILSSGVCDQSVYTTGDLSAGDYTVVVTMDDAGPISVGMEWQHIDHGCEPNEWRVEGMTLHDETIVSVACKTYETALCDTYQARFTEPDTYQACGFLDLPDDFCPTSAATSTCSVSADAFRAAFTTTLTVPKAGIYRFSQRFRDTGVVFIDGVRTQSSGCQNAFGSRCTETTFDQVLTRGDHIISVDLEFEDPPNTKKLLGQLQWSYLGTGNCEWHHQDWGAFRYSIFLDSNDDSSLQNHDFSLQNHDFCDRACEWPGRKRPRREASRCCLG